MFSVPVASKLLKQQVSCEKYKFRSRNVNYGILRGRYQTAAPWPPSFLFYQIYIFQRLIRKLTTMKCHVPQHTNCAGSIYPPGSFKTERGRKRERWTTRQDPVVGCPSSMAFEKGNLVEDKKTKKAISNNKKKN